jgi:putative colanic acid biosynthesis acetyltransferase WcaF
MARQIHYNAAEHISVEATVDPYLRPAFSLKNRLLRLTWNFVWLLLYRSSPRPLHSWRSMILRLYGAKIGPGCHFYPKARVWAPWNLICGKCVTVADNAEVYNPAPITLGDYSILSQAAYLCGATHDYDDPAFPLLAFTINIGEYAWVCARASVAPGVNLGDGAVLGLGSVATRDLEPWSVYAGVPAVRVKDRKRPA